MSNNVNIQELGYLAALPRALEAVKNRNAILLCGGALLLAMTIFGVGNLLAIKLFAGSATTTLIVAIVFAFLASLTFWAGFSGVGLLLMDHAHAIEPRSMIDALIGGLMSTGTFLIVALLDAIFWALFLGVCSLLLLACKIPGIGPVLFVFVYPAIILAAGLVVAIFVFIILPMTFPAIWEGNSLTGIYARRWALFQQRRTQIYISQFVLGLIVSLVATVVSTVFFSGFGVSTLLSVPIVGASIELDNLITGLTSMVSGGGGVGGGGHVVAGMLGGGVLFFIACLIPGLVVISGMNLIYLRSIEGLDFSATEEKISKGVKEAKRRAEEAKVRATEAAQRAREAAAQRGTQKPQVETERMEMPNIQALAEKGETK